MAYASRAMSEAERHYVQIEKEALAAMWACEKFSVYLLGLTFAIESDHKPLVPLLSTKCLNALPPRIIRFRLRLARFSYTINHVPGKLLYTADTLSRAVMAVPSREVADEVEDFVSTVVVAALPASPNRLETYHQAQREDHICRQLILFCSAGSGLKPYWKERGSFTVCENLLLFNNRIVVPKPLHPIHLFP